MGNLCIEKKAEPDSEGDNNRKLLKNNNYYDKNAIATNPKENASRDSDSGGGYTAGNANNNQLVVIGRDIANGPKVSPKITADFAARIQNDDSFKARPIEPISLENDSDNRDFRSNNSALVDSRLVMLPPGLSGRPKNY